LKYFLDFEYRKMEDPQSVETSAKNPEDEPEEQLEKSNTLEASFKHDSHDSNGEDEESPDTEAKPAADGLERDQAEIVNDLKAKLNLNGAEAAHVNGVVAQNGDDHVNENSDDHVNGSDHQNGQTEEDTESYKQEEHHEELGEHHQDSFASMKNSQSNEFTYTSLGSNRPDDLDEERPEEKKQEELRIESVELVLANKAKPTEVLKEKIEADAASTAFVDSIKKLSFDEIIDRVRVNSIANKEVCNYILNLLVGGEFDLEKNFVIRNINSILNMIQVIKCARPALKVSTF
jgi:hypothetical protein